MILDKYGDEIDVFGKRPFLRVDNVFFIHVFEKQPLLRVTAYFFENFFEKRPFLRMITIGGMRDQVELRE